MTATADGLRPVEPLPFGVRPPLHNAALNRAIIFVTDRLSNPHRRQADDPPSDSRAGHPELPAPPP